MAGYSSLLFSSLFFSSLLNALCVSASSALNSFPIFYFQISFFYSIPYFFSSIATRNPNPHDSRILNSGCNFLNTGLLPSPVIL